jgi:AcrR family transcriptional regulator
LSPQDTRTRILEAAAQLFHEQGYHATGIATILRQADVNAGSLYHFFPGKEELLEGVLRWRLEELRPQVTDPAEAATADPVERVFALMRRYRAMLDFTACTMGCPVGNLALELSDSLPRIRALIHANFENWVDVVEGWLVAAGPRLPADVDRRQLARFVLTVMEGGIMQARALGAPGPFEESVAHMRRYFDLLAASARAGGRLPADTPAVHEPAPAAPPVAPAARKSSAPPANRPSRKKPR